MTDAFVYDAVRTPRGKGKSDGSLHEVTALNLATQALGAIKDRNLSDPSVVDDVVLGCVDPVGEAGGDIARAAALTAGYGNTVAGVQINRFCASGLDAINFASAQVMSGQHDMTIGGGVESMSRVGMGASGGAWPMDPAAGSRSGSRSQGPSARRRPTHPCRWTLRQEVGRDRDQIRLLARRRRRLCGREPEALQGFLGRRQLQELR